MKPWLQRRAEPGIYSNLFQELLEAKSLKDYIRMDKMHFDYLVERLYPYLIKQDTITRESIKPSEQCYLFLRYVGSGETFRSLEYQFRVSRQSIARIVERVAEAIIKELQDEYLWNFLNTIGAIDDGKQTVLEQPKNSGSHYRNYKGTDSIIVMV